VPAGSCVCWNHSELGAAGQVPAKTQRAGKHIRLVQSNSNTNILVLFHCFRKFERKGTLHVAVVIHSIAVSSHELETILCNENVLERSQFKMIIEHIVDDALCGLFTPISFQLVR
jgi:hypothetical protein